MRHRETIFVILTSWLFILSCESKRYERNSYSPKEPVLAEEIDTIVSLIAQNDRVTGKHIGIAGSLSEQWDLYERLKDRATENQLISLTDHVNGAVRCYAFHALASKRSDKVFSILLKHLKDTAVITTQGGCIVSREQVKDYFINLVTPERIDLDVYKLSTGERKELDKALSSRD
jgi:hypothetical protein